MCCNALKYYEFAINEGTEAQYHTDRCYVTGKGCNAPTPRFFKRLELGFRVLRIILNNLKPSSLHCGVTEIRTREPLVTVTRTPVVRSTSIACGDFWPLTRFFTTIISLVAPVPPKVLFDKRKAPTTSAFPSATNQLLNFWLLSRVPLDVIKIPIPPSRSLRTFLAMQKS